MINYSTFLWKNPLDEKAVEKAYAKNQVTKVMTFDEFVKHIAEHNVVFTRGTVKGVVATLVRAWWRCYSTATRCNLVNWVSSASLSPATLLRRWRVLRLPISRK